MTHFASSEFWARFHSLPDSVQAIARKQFELLKSDGGHPSLHFKRSGRYRSVRISKQYRALGVDITEGVLWFWIGSHADYDRWLKQSSYSVQRELAGYAST